VTSTISIYFLINFHLILIYFFPSLTSPTPSLSLLLFPSFCLSHVSLSLWMACNLFHPFSLSGWVKIKSKKLAEVRQSVCLSVCLLTVHSAHTYKHASICSIAKSHTVRCTHLITYCCRRLSHHIPPSFPPPSLSGISSHSLLRQLDIQNNRLTTIGSALLPLSNLSELYLACNAIETVAGLPNSLQLNTVDFSNNPINSLEGIQQVNFQFFSLQKNFFFLHFFLSFFCFFLLFVS
jgi:Leucine-rich repeat (LRR) protein